MVDPRTASQHSSSDKPLFLYDSHIFDWRKSKKKKKGGQQEGLSPLCLPRKASIIRVQGITPSPESTKVNRLIPPRQPHPVGHSSIGAGLVDGGTWKFYFCALFYHTGLLAWLCPPRPRPSKHCFILQEIERLLVFLTYGASSPCFLFLDPLQRSTTYSHPHLPHHGTNSILSITQ